MNKKLLASILVAVTAHAILPLTASAAGLRGSRSSMREQHKIAVEEDLTFLRNSAQVQTLVDGGQLVTVEGNENFSMSGVSFPYARPEVKLFIERLAAQHRKETGEQLVVTSLTRPTALQPRNAHDLSVHPAGMAVDFRVPATPESRAWLELALLGLENAQVLDVTRERNPPHYHVAVYPVEYLAYVKDRARNAMATEPESRAEATPVSAGPIVSQPAEVDVAPSRDVGTRMLPIIVGLLLTLTLVASAGVFARARR